MADAKLCITCKHHKPGVWGLAQYSRCRQPEIVAEFGSKVNGDLPFCQIMREVVVVRGGCGPEGSRHELEVAGHG